MMFFQERFPRYILRPCLHKSQALPHTVEATTSNAAPFQAATSATSQGTGAASRPIKKHHHGSPKVSGTKHPGTAAYIRLFWGWVFSLHKLDMGVWYLEDHRVLSPFRIGQCHTPSKWPTCPWLKNGGDPKH